MHSLLCSMRGCACLDRQCKNPQNAAGFVHAARQMRATTHRDAADKELARGSLAASAATRHRGLDLDISAANVVRFLLHTQRSTVSSIARGISASTATARQLFTAASAAHGRARMQASSRGRGCRAQAREMLD